MDAVLRNNITRRNAIRTNVCRCGVLQVDDLEVPIDATSAHTNGAEWNHERLHFYVDGRLVRTVQQGMNYPLQLMIDLFEFPEDGHRNPRNYPKSAHVHSVRGQRSAV
jgi:hypothetical protein